jgi:predicted methyltransferase
MALVEFNKIPAKRKYRCRHKHTTLVLRKFEDIYDRQCRMCKQVVEFNVRVG